MRVDHDVLEWFRSTGKGYQSLMNAVLRSYVEAKKKKGIPLPSESRVKVCLKILGANRWLRSTHKEHPPLRVGGDRFSFSIEKLNS